MSGGVDSSVAALRLVREGHEVIGVFMRNGVSEQGNEPVENGAGIPSRKPCCSATDARDAALVAERLGVPFFAVDYAAEFDSIVAHFADEYRKGRTPNPCVLCNQHLKFGRLLELADGIGADAVATGHYARVENGKLLRAVDRDKDQSYYLFGIPRDALPRARFPLGGSVKDEIRAEAREAGLRTAGKPESMEICFVTSGDYRDVVLARGGLGRPGRFVDRSGRELGTHGGVGGFTVGQRRGLPASTAPQYVVAIDADGGDIVLAPAESLDARTARVQAVRWLIEPPRSPFRAEVRVRARHEPVPARVIPRSDGSLGAAAGAVDVEFETPVRAVTPGQAAVFHDGDLVLGGGWLD